MIEMLRLRRNAPLNEKEVPMSVLCPECRYARLKLKDGFKEWLERPAQAPNCSKEGLRRR